MGAVVVGFPTTAHTPDSGQVCPVLAVVPIGVFDITYYLFIPGKHTYAVFQNLMGNRIDKTFYVKDVYKLVKGYN